MTIDLFNGNDEACGSVSDRTMVKNMSSRLRDPLTNRKNHATLGQCFTFTLLVDDVWGDGELSDGLQGLSRPGPLREGSQEAQHGRPLHGARGFRQGMPEIVPTMMP